MITSRFATPLALAALFTLPAFAQTSTSADVSSGTTTAHGAYVAPLDKAGAKQNAAHDAKQAKSERVASDADHAKADVSCGTTTANGAYVAPLEKAGAKQNAALEGKEANQGSADCVAKPAKTARKKSAKTASSQ